MERIQSHEWIWPLVAGYLHLDEMARFAMTSSAMWHNANILECHLEREAEMNSWFGPDGWYTSDVSYYYDTVNALRDYRNHEYEYVEEHGLQLHYEREEEANEAWYKITKAIKRITGKQGNINGDLIFYQLETMKAGAHVHDLFSQLKQMVLTEAQWAAAACLSQEKKHEMMLCYDGACFYNLFGIL